MDGEEFHLRLIGEYSVGAWLGKMPTGQNCHEPFVSSQTVSQLMLRFGTQDEISGNPPGTEGHLAGTLPCGYSDALTVLDIMVSSHPLSTRTYRVGQGGCVSLLALGASYFFLIREFRMSAECCERINNHCVTRGVVAMF